MSVVYESQYSRPLGFGGYHHRLLGNFEIVGSSLFSFCIKLHNRLKKSFCKHETTMKSFAALTSFMALLSIQSAVGDDIDIILGVDKKYLPLLLQSLARRRSSSSRTARLSTSSVF
jgi:hypothetical protein